MRRRAPDGARRPLACIWSLWALVLLAGALVSTIPSPVAASPFAEQGAQAGPADSGSAPFLLVLWPADGAQVSASPVALTGRTTPGRAVLVLNDDGDVFEASVDEAGSWSALIDLLPGENELVILSVDPDDVSAPILDEDLFVLYVPSVPV